MPRSRYAPGVEVHRRLPGRALCRPGAPQPRDHVGRIDRENSHDLPTVNGIGSDQSDLRTGQENEPRVQVHLHGSGTGDSCQTLAPARPRARTRLTMSTFSIHSLVAISARLFLFTIRTIFRKKYIKYYWQ